MNKVTVSASALREVLSALDGPSYLIGELRATRSMIDNPIRVLMLEYNKEVRRLNDEQVRGKE